jgi:hypothetical protein
LKTLYRKPSNFMLMLARSTTVIHIVSNASTGRRLRQDVI